MYSSQDFKPISPLLKLYCCVTFPFLKLDFYLVKADFVYYMTGKVVGIRMKEIISWDALTVVTLLHFLKQETALTKTDISLAHVHCKAKSEKETERTKYSIASLEYIREKWAEILRKHLGCL